MKKYFLDFMLVLAILFGLAITFTFFDNSSYTKVFSETKELRSYLIPSNDVKQGLEIYRLRNDRYPARIEEAREFMPNDPVDPWGSPFKYSLEDNGKNYIVLSAGEDQEFDSSDDLSYSSKTKVIKEKETRNFLRYFAFGFLGIMAFSYVFSVFILNPYHFMKTFFYQQHTPRWQVLLCVLMASCPFTWPNLIPMSLGFLKPEKRQKLAGLATVLFVLSHVAIGFSIYYAKRFRSL